MLKEFRDFIAKGNVLEWEPHGFGCQVCIDVGREAMMMYRSGADPVAIRAAIERLAGEHPQASRYILLLYRLWSRLGWAGSTGSTN